MTNGAFKVLQGMVATLKSKGTTTVSDTAARLLWGELKNREWRASEPAILSKDGTQYIFRGAGHKLIKIERHEHQNTSSGNLSGRARVRLQPN